MELSLKAYAAHRGVTPRAVREALESGRLTAASCRRGRNRWHINATAADEEWETHTNPAQQRAPEARRGGGGAQGGLWGEPEPPPGPTPTNGNGINLHRAQALKTTFQAQRERLKYEQEAQRLVSREEVDVEAFRLARTLRDRLKLIPARVRDEFAGEDSAVAIEERLNAEIDAALESALE